MPLDSDRTTSGGGTPRVEVGELLMRIAEERGLTFEPAPAGVTDALTGTAAHCGRDRWPPGRAGA